MKSIPTQIYIENEAVKTHGDEIASLGRNAMIITGRHSSAANGSLSDVVTALESRNITYSIYNSVEENPTVETVCLAASAAADMGTDMFVAVGGGSPMDASKAISLLAKNGVVSKNFEYTISDHIVKIEKSASAEEIQSAEKFLYTPDELEYFPVACVPTTCGTGSEVTPYSILTSHAMGTKKSISHKIYPSYALVDAKYLKTASFSGMKNTCVDALAHMIESRMNVNANSFSRAYAEEGLKLWAGCKNVILTEENFAAITENDLSVFMQTSVLAGLSIAYTGTSIPHGLSYTLTYENNVPHGKAVGMFLPGFVKNYGDKKLAEYVVEDLLGFDDISAFRDYIYKLFGRLEISDELWRKDTAGLLANPAKLKNYPFEVTEKMLDSYKDFYNQCD